MNFRGAKTALTLSLHAPDLISNVVAIDNCPISLPIPPDFQKYIDALAEVNKARIKTHSEGERVLAKYEEVNSHPFTANVACYMTDAAKVRGSPIMASKQFYQSSSSCAIFKASTTVRYFG